MTHRLVFASNGDLRWVWSGGEEFGEGNAGDDEGRSCKRARAEALMQEYECG